MYGDDNISRGRDDYCFFKDVFNIEMLNFVVVLRFGMEIVIVKVNDGRKKYLVLLDSLFVFLKKLYLLFKC